MGHEIISPAPLAFFASRGFPEAPECVPRLKDAPIDCPTMIFKFKNLHFCFKDLHEHNLKPPFLSDFPILFTSISVSGHFHLGVSINGGTPSSLYGFFSWKIQIENG